MPYVGVDYHKRYSYLTILDENGRCLKKGQISNEKESLKEFLKSHKENTKAVLEAGCNWTVMHDWLEEIVDEVKLAHPLKVRAIAEAKIKTDKIDSGVLAQLLRCDLLPEAYVPGKETRSVKNILRQRMFFVKMSTMVKNRIHAILDRHPEFAHERRLLGTDMFSKKGKRWLKSLALRHDEKSLFEKELNLLEYLGDRVGESNELVRKLGNRDERVARVKSIPGLGNFLSLLIVNEIDDIRRFRNHKKLAAYAGLVPSTYSSGSRTFHGRITKQGNKWLRYAVVEAVWPAVRADLSLRKYYENIKRNKGSNKAKVATAKRMLTIVYRVLKEDRDYEIRYNSSGFGCLD